MDNQNKKSDKTLVIILVCALGIPALLFIGFLILMLIVMLVVPKKIVKTGERIKQQEEIHVSGFEKETIKYYDYAISYINATANMVNSGSKVTLYETDKIILVPVGKYQCTTIEGELDEDYWKYAYVAVTYNGEEYNYYFIGMDKDSKGTEFLTKSELEKKTGYTYQLSSYAKVIKDAYKVGAKRTVSLDDLSSDNMLKKLQVKTGISKMEILSKYCN